MKSTGIVRKLDNLGRIVIPKEIRRTLELEEKDPVEIFVDDTQIILKKYEAAAACAITGEVDSSNISLADGKLTLSRDSAEKLVREIEKKL